MYIRPLTIDELDLCYPFGEQFHQEKVLPSPFSAADFLANWEHFYRTGIGVIFGLYEEANHVNDDLLIGGIGGILAKDLTSGKLTMNELFWYVQKDKRHSTNRWPLHLVHHLRAWGRLRHATDFRMTHMLLKGEDPYAESLHAIYTRLLKLVPVEVNFMGPIGDYTPCQ